MGERRSNAPDEGCLTAPPLEALLRKEGRRLELEITRKAPVKGEIFHFFLSRTSPLPPLHEDSPGTLCFLRERAGMGQGGGTDGQRVRWTDSQMDGQTAGQRARQGLRKGSGVGGKGRARGRAAPGLTGDLGPNPGQQLRVSQGPEGADTGGEGGGTPQPPALPPGPAACTPPLPLPSGHPDPTRRARTRGLLPLRAAEGSRAGQEAFPPPPAAL